MTPDERDKLLDLHRAAMNAMGWFIAGKDDGTILDREDDAYRAYLFSLPVSDDRDAGPT